MSSGNQDKGFLITFGGVLGALGIFTVTILIIAGVLGTHSDDKLDPGAAARLQERIAPLGTVITDPAALLKTSAAAAPHAAMSGDQIVAQVCSACHGAGVLGAPKIGDKGAWSGRLKSDGGVDGLVSFALKGKNQMPARGGRPDLSDAEVKSAIQYMLKQSGA